VAGLLNVRGFYFVFKRMNVYLDEKVFCVNSPLEIYRAPSDIGMSQRDASDARIDVDKQ
jgi:hypothetical protein